MNISPERPLWIPIQEMVLPGSIGEKLVSGIPTLGERKRPETTFQQPVKLLFHSRGTTPANLIEQGFVVIGDILKQPAKEWIWFGFVHSLSGRLDNYLQGLLKPPHSIFLAVVYGKPALPAPIDREWEIVEGVESAVNQIGDNERIVLIQRYGLHNGITQTLEEVGRGRFVTRERVRQVEAKGIRALGYLTRVDIRGYLVMPEDSFGRKVFGAVLGKDVPPLEGKGFVKDLHLSSDFFEAMRVNEFPSWRYSTIEDLVSKDLSLYEDTSIFRWVKQEISSALKRRAAEVEDQPRIEVEQRAKAEAERRARVGEPRNNLMPGIKLSSEQLVRLDEMLLGKVGFSTRVSNLFKRSDIRTVGELLRKDRKELLVIRNVGVTIATEITENLTAFLDAFLDAFLKSQ